MTTPASGPRISWPAIERKYGRPVDEWMTLIQASALSKHAELVAWLKAEHSVGHGHATALVHEFRKER